LRLLGDYVLGLTLGAHEENRAAFGREAAHEFVSVAEQLHRLAQIDDVDAVSLAEDVLLHLRVPALRLVAEVNTRLQQILHRDCGQTLLLQRCRPAWRRTPRLTFAELEAFPRPRHAVLLAFLRARIAREQPLGL